MIIAYLCLTLFFEKFYYYKKCVSLTREVKIFRDIYSRHIDSHDDSFYSALKKFEDDNNAQIMITSLNGNLVYLSKEFNKESVVSETLANFSADIIQNQKVMDALKQDSSTVIETPFQTKNKTTKLGIVASISLSQKNDSLLFCVCSIQQFEEASQVINEFFLYLFLGLLCAGAVLALIYSAYISKPLVDLTKMANKMADMDFSVVCSSKRDDEIGSLAGCLNKLSSNLHTALLDLQQKNAKLQDDIEKERALEKARKEFTANVSHELKTPIGIIEGYAEGLKDGIVQGEDAAMYLDTIIDEAQKMSVLVSNMLELSRLEAGITKPNFEEININRVANKVLKKHAPDFEANKFNVHFESESPYNYVYADSFQMEQVFTNLITNAIKYTPPGNDINVFIKDLKEQENIIKISVENMGSSIPEQDIEKLFDKFYRVDKSRERTQLNSTGLGLSIVQSILRLHGSEFKIKNIEGGVCFSFTLEKIEIDEEDF